MNKLHLCVPTLNRYDRLADMIASAKAGTVVPTDIWVIDNGGAWISDREVNFIDEQNIQHHYTKFGHNIGCAASWNWFIEQTKDVRIICNDDIQFSADAIEKLVAAFNPNAMLCPDSMAGSAFSCFLLPDNLVEKVGLFDDRLSPNYCYFEDNDLYRRMQLLGYGIETVKDCLVEHAKSSTVSAMSAEDKERHHERFRRAEFRYKSKWGGLPNHEVYETPYNKETSI